MTSRNTSRANKLIPYSHSCEINADDRVDLSESVLCSALDINNLSIRGDIHFVKQETLTLTFNLMTVNFTVST